MRGVCRYERANELSSSGGGDVFRYERDNELCSSGGGVEDMSNELRSSAHQGGEGLHMKT